MRKTLLHGRQPGREAPEFDPVDDGHRVGVSISEIRAAAPTRPDAAPTYPDEEEVRRRGAWIVMAALALAAVAAVVAVVTWGGDSSPPATPAVDVPGQATPAPPLKTEEQKIVDTYLAYWKAQSAALDAADPNYPALALYTTGSQLEVDRDAIQKLRDQGWATRAPANSIAEQRVTVDSIEGDHARFRSCELDDGFVVRADTGEPLAPSRVGTDLWTGEMVRDGGSWKVSKAARQQKWEGVAGCWVGE